MDLFTHIYFRIFCYPTEDPQRVKETLLFAAFGETIPHEINYSETKTSSESKTPVIISEIVLKKNQYINEFFEKIQHHIDVDSLENRVDNKCFFYLRIDKQKAYKKIIQISDSGDSIYCKAKIRVYPAKRTEAVKKLRNYLA
jgi:RNA binding exosome subunit